MVEVICNKITLKIRKEMPEIDDERAEVINYGLQLIIGESPKFLILFFIAYIFQVPILSVLALLISIWRSSLKNTYWMYISNFYILYRKCFSK